MADISARNYKRLNFFRGFRTTEKDWNDGEQYHTDKRKLHNRMMHGPGIVPQALGGLRASGRGRGELAVEVQSGYAVDAEGHDIFVWEPEIKQLNPADFKLPATVYLVARYIEEFSDFISYKENLDFKGGLHRNASAAECGDQPARPQGFLSGISGHRGGLAGSESERRPPARQPGG